MFQINENNQPVVSLNGMAKNTFLFAVFVDHMIITSPY